MAMHFDMYFFHKTSLYGAILVLRTATNEVGWDILLLSAQISVTKVYGANVIRITRGGSSQLSRKKVWPESEAG